MKKLKKEIEILACEICGKSLEEKRQHAPASVMVDEPAMEGGVEIGSQEKFYFHADCVDKLLIKTAKELRQ